MKWKAELIEVATIISQMAFLFYSWWSKWLAEEGSEISIASIVLIIGVLGGVFMWFQKTTNNEENKHLLNIVRWVGGIIGTIGAYLVFIPVTSLIFHSKVTALLLATGFFLPLLVRKLPASMRTSNA